MCSINVTTAVRSRAENGNSGAKERSWSPVAAVLQHVVCMLQTVPHRLQLEYQKRLVLISSVAVSYASGCNYWCGGGGIGVRPHPDARRIFCEVTGGV